MRPQNPIPHRPILLTCAALGGLLLFSSALFAATQFPNPVFQVGSNPWVMVKADFDGDGIDDLMVSNAGLGVPPGELSLLRGLADGTFAEQVRIPLSNAPWDLFSADFNGDGRPDLAVQFPLGGAYLLNQGQGTFGPEIPLPTILGMDKLEMGDFNGDGVDDLVVYGSYSGQQHFFQVLTFVSDRFYAETPVPAGSYFFYPSPYFNFAVADFTGDGKDDIAMMTGIFAGTFDILIYPSVGDGSFLPPLTLTMQGTGARVFAAELNNDGRMDLVFKMVTPVANGGGQADTFLLYGRGDGTFDAGPALFFGQPVNDLVAGDLNRDGVQDFIAVKIYDFTVYLGQGGGGFAAQPEYPIGNDNSQALLSDFQRDGLLDLALLSSGSNVVFTFVGNGDGSFGPAPIEALQNAPVGAAGVGDFNEDGKLDLAAGRMDANQVSILPGHGDGTFGPETKVAGGVGPMALGVADFDADGHMDLAEVVLNWPYLPPNPVPPGSLLVSKGNGDGTFFPPVSYATGPDPIKIAVSDFNGDGVQDVAVLDRGDFHLILPDIRIFLGHAGGALTPLPSRPVTPYPTSIAVGDLNLDGHPDLVVGTRRDRSAGKAVVLLGNGDGTFQDPTQVAQFSLDALSIAVGVADLNGDGRPDLVVADAGDGFPPPANPGAVHVLMGQGDGTFVPGETLFGGYGPYDVSLGDFDGNSTLDLFVESGSTYEAFLPGLGDGTFGPESGYGLFGSPTILGSFDFNGDNLKDLLAISDVGVFVIKRQGGAPTQVLDARVGFSEPRARRRETVGWRTDQEGDLTGFNLITLAPGGHRTQLNPETVACVECTTGRGHSYTATLKAPGVGRAIYIEVLYRDGHTELFGPAERAPRPASAPGLELPPDSGRGKPPDERGKTR